jgi:hypothetical protein
MFQNVILRRLNVFFNNIYIFFVLYSIREPDDSVHFEIFEECCMIEFSSKRKRMTIILRPLDENGKPSEKIKIFCKQQ